MPIHHRLAHAVCCLLAVAAIQSAQAEVVSSSPESFRIRHAVAIDSPADVVWSALVQPGKWWSSSHTFSGSASGLSLDLRAGGCWCEQLANGGSVQHMAVLNVTPLQTLVLSGALGPLQTMGLTGAMTFSLAPGDGGITLTLTYNVGGAPLDGTPLGDAGAVARAVDGVLAEQVSRLKKLAETGTPG